MPSSGVRRGERHRARRSYLLKCRRTTESSSRTPDTSVVPAQHPVESCSVQTTTVPRPGTLRYSRSPTHSVKVPAQKPAGTSALENRVGRAYSFAERCVSVLCLATFKASPYEANSLQIAARCKSLQTNLVTRNLRAAPLDKLGVRPETSAPHPTFLAFYSLFPALNSPSFLVPRPLVPWRSCVAGAGDLCPQGWLGPCLYVPPSPYDILPARHARNRLAIRQVLLHQDPRRPRTPDSRQTQSLLESSTLLRHILPC